VVVLQDSITLANVAGIFRDDKKDLLCARRFHYVCGSTKRAGGSAGAFDNDWTMRVTESMRFPTSTSMRTSTNVDLPTGKNQTRRLVCFGWLWNAPPPRIMRSVARLFDPLTRQPTMVIAGVSPYGTHAAAEFLINPQYLDEFSKKARMIGRQRTWNC